MVLLMYSKKQMEILPCTKTSMHLPLIAQIESLLLYEGEALSAHAIAKTLGADVSAVQTALEELSAALTNRGIVLINNGATYMLATHPEMQPVFEMLRKNELERELTKSALETLTIVAYRGPIAKHDIDYIRGVQSHMSLRNLLVRGLIEKKETEGEPQYVVTTDTLSFLGITATSELPDFDHVAKEYTKILAGTTDNPKISTES